MNKHERVRAALAGAIVDRPPASFWGHDYTREWSAEGLAQATLENQSRYDWDFVKVNPRATYFAEAWGCRYRSSGDPLAGPVLVEHVVRAPADWQRITPQDGRSGPFAEQLQALSLIARGLAGNTPFLQTGFSPLSVARYLAGGSEALVKEHMATNPSLLHQALAALAETLARYAAACLQAGASGIFFATTVWATRDMLTEREYEEFGRRHDLPVLAAVQGASFNVLHVCRDNNMFALLRDYPVNAISWAATLPGNPSLAEGLARTDRAVMGGLSEKTTLLEGAPEDVAREARAALAQTGGRRLLVAPGCSISPQTPPANLFAVKAALASQTKREERRP